MTTYVTTYGLLMTSRDSSELEQLNKTILDPAHKDEHIDQISPNCTFKTEPVDQVFSACFVVSFCFTYIHNLTVIT